MAPLTRHESVWALVRAQFGVISHSQLVALGYSGDAIRHRLQTGRLHRLFRGVYAVGRRQVTKKGMWMAAVLACGEGTVLSHESAAELCEIWTADVGLIHVTTSGRGGSHEGIVVHRTKLGPEDVGTYAGIPVTSPARTLTDLAARYGRTKIERAINDADKTDLVTIAELHQAVEAMPAGTRGRRAISRILDPATFTLTDTELEQRFVPIARAAGLSKPTTQHHINGHRADFYFDDLGLIVEADGGAFHRTPTQQRTDRRHEHAHAIAGTVMLRFTHHQIARESSYVRRVLEETRLRIEAGRI